MKHISLFILILFPGILLPDLAPASSTEDIPDGIILAIKAGNATNLAKYFNVNVELTINKAEEIYSKEQAELILKDFFAKHVPVNFSILHKGGKEGSQYAIGNLSTNNGIYRVTILVKLKDSQPYVHQLRIEEENVQ